MDLILIIGFYIFIKLLITMSDLNAWQHTGDNIMKLSIIELKEIKEHLDKGFTLCLPQTISLKQYDNIIKQIDNYIKKETLQWMQVN